VILRDWMERARSIFAQGMSPDTLALCVAVGLVLGTFPVFWVPTLLCLGAAILLRLNVPALQIVNTLTSPLQLALLIPFHHLGARLLPVLHLGGVWDPVVRAIAGWLCAGVPLGLLLYLALLGILRREAGVPTGCLPTGRGFRTPQSCEIG
jgi:uncharacterized protein (DUF2062 family)